MSELFYRTDERQWYYRAPSGEWIALPDGAQIVVTIPSAQYGMAEIRMIVADAHNERGLLLKPLLFK